MSDSRKIAALRALAERPGTDAEGILAREMLVRLESKQNPVEALDAQFERFLQTGNIEDLGSAVGKSICDCGFIRAVSTTCDNITTHAAIAEEIRQRFPRGARVFYNRWAYAENDPAFVAGYSKEWNWIRLRFDSRKTPLAVPIYRRGKWHLSTEPLERSAIRELGLRGGMR